MLAAARCGGDDTWTVSEVMAAVVGSGGDNGGGSGGGGSTGGDGQQSGLRAVRETHAAFMRMAECKRA